MRYQETWICGQATEQEFQRPCADRYEPIHDFMMNYKRPFSVFDLGANLGYFSFRAAEDFHATCVMADSRPELLGLLKKNAGLNTTWLNGRFGPSHLNSLADCESFDVVLALSVLHHFAEGWRYALDALRRLGDWVIVELPSVDDTGSLNGHLGEDMVEYVETIPGVKHLQDFPSHMSGKPRPMFLIPGLGNRLIKQSVDALDRGAPPLKDVTIESDFDWKMIHIQHGDVSGLEEKRPFIPGMNLWNFLLMNGSWPLKTDNMVVQALDSMSGWHDDLRPWNFILDGQYVHAIDVGNKEWRTEPEEGGLELCLNMIKTRSVK